jgi:hypothetical protein
MRSLLRTSIATVLLLVLAGCGITGDEVADGPSTTRGSTTTSTTEPGETSTTTTEPDEPSTTTGGDSENDPELEQLLLTADDVADYGVEVEVDPDSEPGFSEEEFCEGHNFTVQPTEQAAIGFETPDHDSFLAEAILEFGFEDDASLFLEELQSLNEACKTIDEDNAIPATFDQVTDLGDEAVRALPDPGADPLDVIVVRADERIILLAAFGDPILDNALIIQAVEQASP